MNIVQNLEKLMDNGELNNSRLAQEIHVRTGTTPNRLGGEEIRAENPTALREYFGCFLDHLAGTTTEKAPAQEGECPKSRLQSIVRLEDSKIVPEQDEQIADYIDFPPSRKRNL